MNKIIGENLVLVDGAKKWGLYDFNNKNIIRFNSKVGELLYKISTSNISLSSKINIIKTKFKHIYRYLENANLIERIFKNWNFSVSKESYSRKMLWVELTDKCNYKCIHCYNESDSNNNINLNLDKIYQIIKEGYNNKFNAIQFSGGEPLLHPDITKILEYSKDFKYNAIEIYTNLSLITDKQIDFIENNNIHIATTLLGSNKEIFEKCTKINGSFEKWQQNALKIKKRNIPFRVSVVRMKQNEHDMKNIEIFLKKHGLIKPDDEIFPDDVRPTGRTSIDYVPEYPYLNEKQLKQFVEITEEKFFFSTIFNSCWGGSLAIAANGNIYPCIFSRQEKIGNINNSSLSDIIENKVHKYWGITLDFVEKCTDCEFRYGCYDCRAISLNYGNGLYGKPVRCSYNPYDASFYTPTNYTI